MGLTSGDDMGWGRTLADLGRTLGSKHFSGDEIGFCDGRSVAVCGGGRVAVAADEVLRGDMVVVSLE